ncbi:hypothetical protein ACH4VR_29465 [Streptomyces sp. NPDC020883]|uniref:hypothetical protein n=1 Tax=Streptomyces sp. NPDC020883 TaxID=3365099 RepID=UPI0037927B83
MKHEAHADDEVKHSATRGVPPTRADVPGMLAAAYDLACAGSGRLAPAVLRRKDVAQIAEHIGAAEYERRPGGGFRFKCPACKEWDFGATLSLDQAVNIRLKRGRLPAAAILAGACLACEHSTQPQGRDIPLED